MVSAFKTSFHNPASTCSGEICPVMKKLKAQGFSEVYRMTGGMMEWGNLQLPLVKQ